MWSLNAKWLKLLIEMQRFHGFSTKLNKVVHGGDLCVKVLWAMSEDYKIAIEEPGHWKSWQ